MGEVADPGRLTQEDLEAVIRRAVQIEAARGSEVPGLSEEDVLRIAAEVGLTEESARQALAEHLAATRERGLLVERGWASGLIGPALVTTSRRVSLPGDEVLDALEAHFKKRESLRLVRRLPAGSLWEPERGVVASVMRSVDLAGHGYELAKARAVEVRVVGVGASWTRLTLVADLGDARAGWFWGFGIGLGGIAGGAPLVVGLMEELYLLAAAGAPIWAGAIWLARTAHLRRLEKVRLTLEGLLDRLEHGESLEPPRPSWRDLLG